MFNIKSENGWPAWLDTYDHVGSHYPYYNPENFEGFSLQMEEALESIPPKERQLDLAGVLETLFCGWPLGNRTLVTGLRRSPWMAEPVENGWKYETVPDHGNTQIKTAQVASELTSMLEDEARDYIGSRNHVGILLSGGLDSRIVAGIVRSIEIAGDIDSVTAYTWGIDRCRDVYYGRKIAQDFNWQFEHFTLSSDTLRRNIDRAGELGAEFSPLHLHALPEVRDQANVDVILAGSYGNSIGRGEYSGSHVTDINKTVPFRLNKFGALRSKVASRHRKTVKGDAYGYRTRIERSKSYQYREIEKQLHYLRRLLQPCMTHVAEKTPLYQMFTSPQIVGLMWGLDPSIRGDSHCTEVLRELPGNLEQLPNAKSGVPPVSDSPVDDGLHSDHHSYGEWLRNDLYDYIIDTIRSGHIYDVSNRRVLERLFKIWPHANTRSTNRIDELLSWLASVSIFIETYDLRVETIQTDYRDITNNVIGPASALMYQFARELVRD